MLEWTLANSRMSCACDHLVLGILCFQFFEFCSNEFCLHLLFGRILVLNMAHSITVLACVPLGPPSIWGVTFHYNDGIMSFGVGFWSIFPPSWIDFVSASPYWILQPPQGFPALNCFSFYHAQRWGLWWEDLGCGISSYFLSPLVWILS